MNLVEKITATVEAALGFHAGELFKQERRRGNLKSRIISARRMVMWIAHHDFGLSASDIAARILYDERTVQAGLKDFDLILKRDAYWYLKTADLRRILIHELVNYVESDWDCREELTDVSWRNGHVHGSPRRYFEDQNQRFVEAMKKALTDE